MSLLHRSLLILSALALALAVSPGFAGSFSRRAAETLLSTQDDAGWSLEAMMAARRAAAPDGQHIGAAPPEVTDTTGYAHAPPPKIAALRQRIKSLQAQVSEGARARAALKVALTQACEPKATHSAPSEDVTTRLRIQAADLRSREREISVLTNQLSTLKAALNEREKKLQLLSQPQDALRHALTQKDRALANDEKAMSELRAGLAQKSEALDLLQAQSRQLASGESAGLRARDDALRTLKQQAANREAVLKTLQETAAQQTARLVERDKAVADLNAALKARGDELRQAAASVADLRQKQTQDGTELPNTDARRQSYMAGVMMADGLSQRLEGWHAAGVTVDKPAFQTGLTDGLTQHLRLKPVVATKAREAFMAAVRRGANRQVAAAQKQLETLAKGLKPLKSVAGITWFRVRAGKPVRQGLPVTLSMTEQVAGGRVISRVPPLNLRPGDDIPSVVKDGMYLPGEGGEVVARGLARAVYGELPLPDGVQPWTVMEYHLVGVAPGPNKPESAR
ncbi:TPA: hypothetical protein R1888_004830 [Klebsiella oxytoca]|nr:hypothetical protein [Klebsiella oxytoca]